tara:strand:+ start:7414 stop:9405 length:1992 start_codon:yes stop_codon:yes gene_type:complete
MADQTKNPRNAESTLFRRLTRLFSGPITNYRSQMTRDYKRSQLDYFSTKFKSASGQQFKRSGYNPFAQINSSAMANQRRSERYTDFDQMEYTPEIASALDIYADEMTTHSSLQPMLTIKCPNAEIKAVLSTLYQNILNIEYNLFGWCRTMCKYGDFFLYLDIDEKIGIKTVIGLPSAEVERLEGEDKTNPNYVQFQWNSAAMTFENWQVGHFRILGNDKYTPYGTSVLEAARRIWRQLILMEDAMMAYRVVRAPERRVFYVDVGNIPPTDVEQYMQKVMTSMKRNQLVDSATGRVDLRYNPMSVEEDYFIPVRGDSSSKVESLAGGQNTGDIDDVKYLRDKLFSALKIPASYLTQGDDKTEDKTTLAQKDMRFARTIQRLQRAVIAELEKIGIIHLYTLGFRGDDLLNFSLYLNNPSKLAELQELEHWKTKFDIAANATEGYFSRRWICEHLFNMSEEEFVRNQRELFYDKKYDAQINAAAEAAGEAEASLSATGTPAGGEDAGGGLGDLGDLGGGAEGEADLGGAGDAAAPAADTAPAGGDEDSVLLAEPPAKRDIEEDGSYITPGAKGKRYTPAKRDKRKDAGPRTRNMRSAISKETSTRTTFPGWKGSTGMNQLRNMQMEDQRSNYEKRQILDENMIFQTNYEIEKLIEGLGTKETKDEA